MIVYKEEQLKDFILEFAELLKPHMSEISVTEKLGFEFKPDYIKYVKLQELGVLVVITCRDDEKLIGYSVFGISQHIRYTDCKLAKEDLYYIAPEYRGKGLGKRLFIETEEVLKKHGVNQIILTTKVYSDNSHILGKLGYDFFEKVFTKRIL